MKELLQPRNLLLVILLVLLVGLVTVDNPRFLSRANIDNLILHNAALALLAFGMTFVILTGGIDLSVGSVLGLSACVTGLALEAGYGVPASFAAGLATGGLCGSFNGFLVTVGRMPPILVTLGGLMFYRGLAYGLTGGEDLSGFPSEAYALGMGSLRGLPYAFWLLLAVFVCCLFLRHSRWGRSVYAMGGNETAARLAGLPVNRDKFLVYLFIGLLAGVGGLLYTSRFGSVRANYGELLELQAITCVVLGGISIFGERGTLWGSLFGVALLAVLQKGMNLMAVSQEWQTVAVGALLIVVIALNERVPWRELARLLGRGWSMLGLGMR